ncbi:hypothetical protein N7495_006946 [Penicillium taxi]|uniref:uncharacterized protein n=1 Tax=Penicillium taxi TaxID=168475 RepID=UPI002545A6C5|nr:uncharacterized protein N7495_006946 [Penicillium taxi]KAJ5895255.1 hypothetical protein N7495_006946 [Penicillium taxi]
MDKNYLDRINLRKHILKQQPDECAVANAAAQPAINELYTWLMGTYLPQRFPTMFELLPSKDGKPQQLSNLVTGDVHPVLPPSSGPTSTEALRIIGETVEEDFMILMPSSDGRGYSLQGIVACFPSSWSPKEKFGMTLREIHVPVPKYKEKLEMSLERFLGRVEPGTYVRRANWTVTLDNALWSANSYENHAFDEVVKAVDTIDPEIACVRSERQTVHRLPQSGAICFCFKSFIYPLTDIKAEGWGEELSQAIDGLQKGSVPEIHHYKRAGVWGEAVKAYLRS